MSEAPRIPSGQIGRSIPRVEAHAKVTGTAEYIHNLRLPGMLWAKICRSTVPHGRIRHIDTSAAAAIPGDCRGSAVWSGAVQVRYRYRLYPTPGQQQALARVFGCARVVYNDCLRLREECHAAGEKISDTEVQRCVITRAKLTPEREWLAEAPSVALVQACNDARRA